MLLIFRMLKLKLLAVQSSRAVLFQFREYVSVCNLSVDVGLNTCRPLFQRGVFQKVLCCLNFNCVNQNLKFLFM